MNLLIIHFKSGCKLKVKGYATARSVENNDDNASGLMSGDQQGRRRDDEMANG